MSNPVFVDCPANTWTKVAENVTSGHIYKKLEEPYEYLYIRRDAGAAHPTTRNEGIIIFIDDPHENFGAKVESDIYIYPINADGRVMVDI